jgi:hypothetical protein
MITLRNARQRTAATTVDIREYHRVLPAANGAGDDSWTIVVVVGGVGIPLTVKRQPNRDVRQPVLDGEGKQVTDNNGPVVEVVSQPQPDLVDRLTTTGEIGRETVELEGAFDAFQEAIGARGNIEALMKAAMLEVGMIPNSLDPA